VPSVVISLVFLLSQLTQETAGGFANAIGKNSNITNQKITIVFDNNSFASFI
jgi:hypothetical protein